MTCPECGAPVGGESRTDPYKHTIQCLHLPNEGVERLLAQYAHRDDLRAQRITAALRQAQAET